ncbi:MAG: choice-of-anchor D domain-containing protein [Pseudarcicella sp.]|nr:choice-of-anchor D domain-containing protein [Pseudarcicella sp.]
MKKNIHFNQSDFLGVRKLLLCLLVFLPLLNYGQTTATESFEGETTFNVYDNAFSESGINFEVTGTRMRVAWGQGFGSNGSAVYFETTTLINHSNQNIGGFRITNAATSFKINSFACWTSNDIDLLVHNSGTVTFIGTKPDGTTVSATRNIVPLPNGLDYHEGITFAGTALENVQLIKLEFQLPSNLLYFSIDNINFTTAPIVSSQYSINDVSAIEANSGTNTHTFTVSRTNSSATGSVTVNTANGTATSGVDYTAISSQVVNFAIGELTKTVNVTVNGDVSLEPNETYFVNLTSPVGGTLLDAQGVGNILDDDAVTETFEGETNGGATFSQNGISFSATQDLKVYTAATFGSGSSNSWLHSTIGNGGNAASTGKINITTGNRAIKLISFDAWTSNADGNNGFATGVVRLIGTKLDGTTVQADFTVTPTNNTGTGWQQNISFASTPFNNQLIKAIELVVVSGINYISVDNIKFSSEILAPEIDVVDAGNVAIANGSNTASASNNTQFGNVCAAGTGSISKTYTIKNTDVSGTLNLSGSPIVSITGADASSFSVSTQPSATVSPSGSTTFTVAFDPTISGVKNATISIVNDDANENPYTFAIQGTGNASITATFNAVNPICSGATLAPLPTTSTNSVTGTWSPALSNTASGTYTFTPTAGQCTTGTSSLSVTVNPLVTATFNAVNPICSGATLAPLPTTSTNSVTGTWSPALSNTASGTYTFTPTAGQCTTGTSSLSVTVKPSVSKAHVNNAVAVSGDGLSWATAFKNLQEGLNACSVTEVWVAEGKYLPTEDEFGNSSPIDVRSKTFMMKNGANVFGGFPASGNPVIGDRNPKDYVTTLSGDFNNDDVVTGTGATLNINNNSENAYHVVAVGESITAITQINGLTIEGGNADDLNFISFLNLSSGFDGQNGGAVFLANNPAEFQIKNCILKNNSAFEYGGAIYSASSSNLNLTESVLTNNKANYGSGIYTYQNTALDISKSVMIGNLANISASAMFFTFGNNNVVSNTDILNNHVSVFEGSVCAATLASATIVNSIIWGNTGDGNTSLEEFFGGAFDIQYSDIEGSSVYPGVNNVLVNPGFKNANNPIGDDGKWLTADDGLMLKTCSPLVDVALDYHPTDILGNPMVDVLTVGGASITDIGAYESQIANIYSLLMDTDSLFQDVNNNVFVNSDCELAAKILPIGGSTAVNSDVKVKVFVSATSSPNYLRRHYEITPTVNPNTATASVTLYFTQADFDAYNVSNALKLPTGPTDGLNKLNLKIVKFSGVSSNGFPSGYPSEPVTIIPDTSKIVWNGAYWSVTFDVSGFSGFFVNTPSAAPLSASLASFTAKKNSSKSNILVWNVTNETDFKGYEIEKSTDGKLFEKVGFVQANHSPSYKFVDNNVSANANYYRLKMINTNETWVHSRIEYVENGTENTRVSQVYPNPVSGKQIRIDIESNEDKILQTQIVDILGMQYLAKDIKVQAGINKVIIDLPNLLSKIYFIRLKDQSGKEFVRKFSLK